VAGAGARVGDDHRALPYRLFLGAETPGYRRRVGRTFTPLRSEQNRGKVGRELPVPAPPQAPVQPRRTGTWSRPGGTALPTIEPAGRCGPERRGCSCALGAGCAGPAPRPASLYKKGAVDVTVLFRPLCARQRDRAAAAAITVTPPPRRIHRHPPPWWDPASCRRPGGPTGHHALRVDGDGRFGRTRGTAAVVGACRAGLGCRWGERGGVGKRAGREGTVPGETRGPGPAVGPGGGCRAGGARRRCACLAGRGSGGGDVAPGRCETPGTGQRLPDVRLRPGRGKSHRHTGLSPPAAEQPPSERSVWARVLLRRDVAAVRRAPSWRGRALGVCAAGPGPAACKAGVCGALAAGGFVTQAVQAEWVSVWPWQVFVVWLGLPRVAEAVSTHPAFFSPSTSLILQGELHSRSDTGHHGQKGQHQKHVCDCPRWSRQINLDWFSGMQSWYHCLCPCGGDPFHRHKEGWAGAVHHHQINVSSLPSGTSVLSVWSELGRASSPPLVWLGDEGRLHQAFSSLVQKLVSCSWGLLKWKSKCWSLLVNHRALLRWLLGNRCAVGASASCFSTGTVGCGWSHVAVVRGLSWEHRWRRTWQLCRCGQFEDLRGHEKGSKRRLGLVGKA